MHIYAHILLLLSELIRRYAGISTDCGLTNREENYKREILKLRIENERLKKNYTVKTLENGEQVYVPLKPKNSK